MTHVVKAIASPLRRQKRAGHIFNLIVAALAMVFITSAAQAQVRDIVIDDGIVSRIRMNPGETLTVETSSPYSDILIGNTNILDVFPLTDTSLYIQSKGTGLTNVTLYSEEKRLLEVIDVRVRSDFSELESALRAAVPSAQVSVTNVNDRIRLSGEVKDSRDLQTILEISQKFSGEAVINSVRVADPRQVELDVRILEVERNSGRELGVGLTGISDSGRGFTTGQGAATAGGQPFGTFVGNLLEISGTQVDFVINALEAKGLARRLANPKLTTTSGVEANFVVGGEVPISRTTLAENGSAASETSYREYGVKLNFLPVVLDRGLINLRVTPEVSDVDFSNLVNGQPSFFTRRADTTVSLRDGQSFAIAGLLQSDNARNIQQLPWLGQVPIIGTLFRSTGFQKSETDLVIVVTPRLVRPVAPNEQLVTPLDGTRSSDDVELFLYGMLEVDRPLLRKFREGADVVGPYGHMIELEFDDALIIKK
ncbi:type II and III secretion system protein family protein [Sulfitobacter aestuariivivens]|uniref:Type II and III secretion system protein family protein n=1 Tax=Sulfitobacter aestuariivivens TaxID=2766981 RepID=A0A927D8Q9_9RHOB|nr:type II and III secretion system protein family protein [Sulfitobacter aestuariivivens]MBD3666208.1 type II and III secretion system protein family protein [Sulfitobacter aestuariivivens]